MSNEYWTALDDQTTDPLLGRGNDRGFEIGRSPHFERNQFDAERSSHLGRWSVQNEGTGGCIPEDACAGEPWTGLPQNLQLLTCQFFWSGHETRDVSSGMRIALDEPVTDRISGRCDHDDRDCLRRIAGGMQRGRTSGR